MKRMTLILGAAALAAISAPIPARAQTGCSWWDLTCNGLASRVTDYGWHIAGRDANGNVVYMRRLVDSNGNVIIERARRDNYGAYQLFNTHTIRNGTVYNRNGELCRYNQNEHGYKEECKYAKGSNFSGIRYPSSNFAAAGTDKCKYESNQRGYKEQCSYAKVNNVRYHAPKYKTPKVRTIRYEPPKAIHYDNDVKGPKPHEVNFHAEKPHGERPHEDKGRGPKR